MFIWEEFPSDVSQLYWTSAYSLAFYLTLTAVVNVTKFDAWILSNSKDEKVRKYAYAMTFEGRKKRVFMDSTIQSLLSSVISSLAAFHLVYIHRNWATYTPEKLLFNEDAPTFFYCSLMTGYFASDLIVELIFFRCFDEFGMIIHHVIFLFCCVHNLKNKVFTFQFIWLSLCECSTPFVNVRWILHTLGLKDSKLYLVNGGFLTLTFIFFRVFVYTLGLYHLWTLYPVLLASDKPLLSKYLVPSFLVVGYLLNLLWSSKIARGLYSLLTKDKKAKRKSK